jgi:hypothetical protein
LETYKDPGTAFLQDDPSSEMSKIAMMRSILLLSLAFVPAVFGQAAEWGQCGGTGKPRNIP